MKALLTVMLASGLACTAVEATTIDFTALPNYTAVNTQFSGLVFSLQGGPDFSGSPLVSNVWSGGVYELNNSNSGDYPTANAINIAFANNASGISFTYENYGSGNNSFYTAYNAANQVVSTGSLDLVSNFAQVAVAGSGIRNLEINNGRTSGSWEYGIHSLSFTAGAVPEPASWALMIGGFGIVGAAMRRRAATTTAAIA